MRLGRRIHIKALCFRSLGEVWLSGINCGHFHHGFHSSVDFRLVNISCPQWLACQLGVEWHNMAWHGLVINLEFPLVMFGGISRMIAKPHHVMLCHATSLTGKQDVARCIATWQDVLRRGLTIILEILSKNYEGDFDRNSLGPEKLSYHSPQTKFQISPLAIFCHLYFGTLKQ